MRALSDQQILHIYGDTTLEYPETLQYVKRFRKEHPKTPFLISRNNDKDFYDLCEKTSGPPSRVMRWGKKSACPRQKNINFIKVL